ncbi:unnamed protein product, partial [Nesidiocoris tenuis]
MDHTNADLDPLTFSDRIPRTICIKLEQTTTVRTSFIKIGSAWDSWTQEQMKKKKYPHILQGTSFSRDPQLSEFYSHDFHGVNRELSLSED